MERDPRQVFESLFGEGGTAQQRATRLREKGSILDYVVGDAARLQTGLPAEDRHLASAPIWMTCAKLNGAFRRSKSTT